MNKSPWATKAKPIIMGYLIDPISREITHREYDGSLKSIYDAIGVDGFECARFDTQSRDTIFVDENGLLNDPTYFFTINGYMHPLAGKGFLLGCDETGKAITPHNSLEAVRKNVTFLRRLGDSTLCMTCKATEKTSSDDAVPVSTISIISMCSVNIEKDFQK